MLVKYQVPGNIADTGPWGTNGAESIAFSLKFRVCTKSSGASFCRESSLGCTSERIWWNLARGRVPI